MTQEELQQYHSLEDILRNPSSLTPLFQPIVALKQQTIYGYEGLIRGPSDSLLHSPITLFNTAQRHGMLAELDLLCREVIINQFGKLQLDGRLFINTAPESLLQADYPHGLTLKLLKRAGLLPQQIVIELTEQYPIDDYDLMRQATEHYRNMGFSIALDDLGAGYSGLRTWSELKPDFVKLDRHFLQNIHEDRQKRQFVQSMIDIAQSINCKVIGEGIEVRQEYLTAQSLDMQFTQGYYFGRPSQTPERELELSLFAERRISSIFTSGRPRANTLVSSLLTPLIPMYMSDSINTVGDRFQADTQLIALPVVNDQFEVVGIVWRDEFMTLYASRYGRELHGRKSIQQIMDVSPLVVETDLPLQALSYQITSQSAHQQHSMFIITEHGRYRGVGSLLDLLRQITDMQITMARHANPLSGLPGNVPISETIREAISDERDVTVCYFDLDNFKPYNDIYGYGKGDKVIRLTAKTITDHVDSDVDFVGHVGGDDFIIIFESSDWQNRCEQIQAAFTTLYPLLYQQDHLQQGGITALDRHGISTFYPLLCSSIGAVRLQDFSGIKSETDLADLASRAKSKAKRPTGNSLYQLEKEDYTNSEDSLLFKLAL